MIDVSPIQLLMVLAIALVVLGPRRLPRLGRDLGRGLRELRGALTAHDERDEGPGDEAAVGEWSGPEPPRPPDGPRGPEGPD